MSTFVLSNLSQMALDQVIDEYRRTPEEKGHENLGRMLVAMYRNQAHPARMLHLIAQFAETAPEDIEPLTLLAWAMSEEDLGLLQAIQNEVN